MGSSPRDADLELSLEASLPRSSPGTSRLTLCPWEAERVLSLAYLFQVLLHCNQLLGTHSLNQNARSNRRACASAAATATAVLPEKDSFKKKARPGARWQSNSNTREADVGGWRVQGQPGPSCGCSFPTQATVNQKWGEK